MPHTEVLIIGAGPGGLVLGNVLLQAGIDCVIVERRSREHIEHHPRAGVIEHRTVSLLERLGLARNLLEQGRRQGSCEFRLPGGGFELDCRSYTNGASHHLYPQQHLVRDLVEHYLSAGGELEFLTEAHSVESHDARVQVCAVSVDASTTSRPTVWQCRHAVLCDGAQARMAATLPAQTFTIHQRSYPYTWLTVLAATAPSKPHVVYSMHESGFAAQIPRSSNATRYYLQCLPGDDPTSWPDEVVLALVAQRLGQTAPAPGAVPILSRNVLPLVSTVRTPMQYGTVHLVGDAAHSLPPAGGKGMNLAIGDAAELGIGLTDRYRRRGASQDRLSEYSAKRLSAAWEAFAFSDWLLHTINRPVGLSEQECSFELGLRRSRLKTLQNDAALASWFARSYVGAD